MRKITLVGIDVSAKTLAVTRERPGGRVQLGEFANDAPGHRHLVRWLTKGGAAVRVCMEATGVYGFEWALVLVTGLQMAQATAPVDRMCWPMLPLAQLLSACHPSRDDSSNPDVTAVLELGRSHAPGTLPR